MLKCYLRMRTEKLNDYNMKCKKCNSENIIGFEYIWVGDCIMEWRCADCGRCEHRGSWLKIVSSDQPDEFGPVYYELEWGKKAKNQYIKND